MKKVTFLMCFLALFVWASSFAQKTNPMMHNKVHKHVDAGDKLPDHRTCGTVEYNEQLMSQNPEFRVNHDQIEEFTAKWAKTHKPEVVNGREIITIPIVIHVVYKTATQNIPDSRVLSQINVLNTDFAGINADTIQIPTIFQNLKANLGIQFCLATRAPNGTPTTGIERRQTTVTSFGTDNAMKHYSTGGLDAWPNDQYFNIWVCNLGNSLLGYAQFPGGPAATDGVVILYSAFGVTGGQYGLGRTTTHEIGHCFNFYHIWGDDGSACSGTDQCNDTPNQADENYGCPSYPNPSCSNTSDMFMNYMDYVDDACMMMFTWDQKARAQALFVPGGYRYQLRFSQGCSEVDTCAPVVNFEADELEPALGGVVSFSDLTSFNVNCIATTVAYAWSFEGGTPSTSSDQHPQNIMYTEQGTFGVSLTVTTDLASTTFSRADYITVGGGSSAWIEQNSAFATASRGIQKIQIVDNNIVWAIAYDGSGGGAACRDFTRTVNGGETWTAKTLTGTGITSAFGLGDIFPVSDLKAWAALYNGTSNGGKIMYTTNGGVGTGAWVAQATATFTAPDGFPNVVYMFDENNGYCMGDPNKQGTTGIKFFEIYTTTNGGTTWTRVPQANIAGGAAPLSGEFGYTGLCDGIGDIVWFGTNKGRVFKSVDRGYNWTVAATGMAEVNELDFKDEMNGLVIMKASAAYGIAVTTDGGATWNDLLPSGAFREGDLAFIPGTGNFWVNVSADQANPGSGYSLDDAVNFTQIDSGVQYTAVAFHDVLTGWAGGFNQSATVGGIYKWNNILPVTPSISFSANVTVTCLNSDVVFTAVATVTPDSVKWEFGEGNPIVTTSLAPITVQYETAGLKTVTLTMYFEGQSYVASQTDYISVGTAPATPVLIDQTICFGNDITFNTSFLHTNWYTAQGTFIVSDSVFTPVVLAAGVDTFYATYYVGICESEPGMLILTVNAVPDAPIVTGAESCFGDTVRVSAEGTSIKWYAEETLTTLVGEGNTLSEVATEVGTFNAYATQTVNGCTSLASTAIAVVNPLPTKPVIVADADTLKVTEVYLVYQWADLTGIITDATSQKYAPAHSGTYFVTVANEFACAAASDPLYFEPSSVNSVVNNNGLSIYPNPNSGQFKVMYTSNENETVIVNIYSATGQLVFTQKLQKASNELTTNVNLSSFQKGVYSLQLVGKSKTINQKVVIK